MNETKTVHQCLFCPQTFDSASDKDDHILEHFAQETCTDCNQHLIRIGGYLYTRHNEATCIKKVPTSEEHAELRTANKSIPMIPEKNVDDATMSLDLDTYESELPQIKAEPVDQEILMNANELALTLCTTHESDTNLPTSVNILNIRNRFPNINLNPVVMLEDILRHNKKKVLMCTYEGCKELLRNQLELSLHQKTHIGGNHVHSINGCGKQFTFQSTLKLHRSGNRKVYKKMGTFQKQDRNNKQKHVQEQSEEQPEPVTTLDYNDVDTQAEYLLPNDDEPMEITKSDDENDVPNTGNYEFTKAVELNIEFDPNLDLQQEQADAPGRSESEYHKCDICDDVFLHKSKLKVHVLRVHTGIGQFYCEICKKNLATRRSLYIHMKFVHGPRKYKCEMCESSFARQYELQRHTDIMHLNITKFKCNTCGMTFKHKQYLSKHLQIHSKEKPYKCTYVGCDKCFTNRAAKNRHEYTHTSEKPYACEIEGCERAFRYSETLKNHIAREHGISTFNYSCEICSEIFEGKKKLMKHTQEKHSDIE